MMSVNTRHEFSSMTSRASAPLQFPKPAPIDIELQTLERNKTTEVMRMCANACARTCQTENGTVYIRRKERDEWGIEEK